MIIEIVLIINLSSGLKAAQGCLGNNYNSTVTPCLTVLVLYSYRRVTQIQRDINRSEQKKGHGYK